jgi:hypothetical protein
MMTKKLKIGAHDSRLHMLVLLIMAVILGFACGLAYAHQTSQPAKPSLNVTIPTPVCNCPNIPAGQNPADTCKC